MRWQFAALLGAVFATLGCQGANPPPPPPPPPPADSGVVTARQPDGWDQGVALHSPDDLDAKPDVVELNLTARLSHQVFLPGIATQVWSYNGQVPGPLIRARVGDEVVVHLSNALMQDTLIHWHGVRVPNAMDGTPMVQDPVQPDAGFTYRFRVNDPGLYWYHPHTHSSGQVGFGLYGALLVTDPTEPPLGDDLVLVLSDIGIQKDGGLDPADSDGWFGSYFGREGAQLLVNGRIMPTLVARVGVPQRWRIVNAARSRYMKFRLPSADVFRIGGDRGLIERPLSLTAVELAPGQRVELWVKPKAVITPAATVKWEDSNRFHIAVERESEPMFLWKVVAAEPGQPEASLPAELRPIEALPDAGAKPRIVDFGEGSKAGVGVLTIDGKTTEENQPYLATEGDTEHWTVKNSTPYDHPFHLHGYFFQVKDVDGVARPFPEWSDTVNLPAKKSVRFLVRYEDRPGMWMFHCHILDHADLGMMAMLHVHPKH